MVEGRYLEDGCCRDGNEVTGGQKAGQVHVLSDLSSLQPPVQTSPKP